MNITIQKLINDKLENDHRDLLDEMNAIALAYHAREFYGLGDRCADLVDRLSKAYGCSYFEASKFFADQMRERFSINVH